MTALIFNSAQRSRMAIASFFCCSVGNAGLLGQSMLPTVATQTPRNSRGTAGGSSFWFVFTTVPVVGGELVRGGTQLPMNTIKSDSSKVSRIILPSCIHCIYDAWALNYITDFGCPIQAHR